MSLVLIVVWLLVSAAWAWLAYDKYKSSIDIRIWLALVRLLSSLRTWWSGGHHEASS